NTIPETIAILYHVEQHNFIFDLDREEWLAKLRGLDPRQAIFYRRLEKALQPGGYLYENFGPEVTVARVICPADTHCYLHYLGLEQVMIAGQAQIEANFSRRDLSGFAGVDESLAPETVPVHCEYFCFNDKKEIIRESREKLVQIEQGETNLSLFRLGLIEDLDRFGREIICGLLESNRLIVDSTKILVLQTPSGERRIVYRPASTVELEQRIAGFFSRIKQPACNINVDKEDEFGSFGWIEYLPHAVMESQFAADHFSNSQLKQFTERLVLSFVFGNYDFHGGNLLLSNQEFHGFAPLTIFLLDWESSLDHRFTFPLDLADLARFSLRQNLRSASLIEGFIAEEISSNQQQGMVPEYLSQACATPLFLIYLFKTVMAFSSFTFRSAFERFFSFMLLSVDGLTRREILRGTSDYIFGHPQLSGVIPYYLVDIQPAQYANAAQRLSDLSHYRREILRSNCLIDYLLKHKQERAAQQLILQLRSNDIECYLQDEQSKPMPVFRIGAVNNILGKALTEALYLSEEEPEKTASGLLVYHISPTPTNLRLSDERVSKNPNAFVGAKPAKGKKRGESAVKVPSDLVGCAQFLLSRPDYDEPAKAAAVKMLSLLIGLEKSSPDNPIVRHLCRTVTWFKPNLLGRFRSNASRPAAEKDAREIARAILGQSKVAAPKIVAAEKPAVEKAPRVEPWRQPRKTESLCQYIAGNILSRDANINALLYLDPTPIEGFVEEDGLLAATARQALERCGYSSLVDDKELWSWIMQEAHEKIESVQAVANGNGKTPRLEVHFTAEHAIPIPDGSGEVAVVYLVSDNGSVNNLGQFEDPASWQELGEKIQEGKFHAEEKGRRVWYLSDKKTLLEAVRSDDRIRYREAVLEAIEKRLSSLPPLSRSQAGFPSAEPLTIIVLPQVEAQRLQARLSAQASCSFADRNDGSRFFFEQDDKYCWYQAGVDPTQGSIVSLSERAKTVRGIGVPNQAGIYLFDVNQYKIQAERELLDLSLTLGEAVAYRGYYVNSRKSAEKLKTAREELTRLTGATPQQIDSLIAEKIVLLDATASAEAAIEYFKEIGLREPTKEVVKLRLETMLQVINNRYGNDALDREYQVTLTESDNGENTSSGRLQLWLQDQAEEAPCAEDIERAGQEYDDALEARSTSHNQAIDNKFLAARGINESSKKHAPATQILAALTHALLEIRTVERLVGAPESTRPVSGLVGAAVQQLRLIYTPEKVAALRQAIAEKKAEAIALGFPEEILDKALQFYGQMIYNLNVLEIFGITLQSWVEELKKRRNVAEFRSLFATLICRYTNRLTKMPEFDAAVRYICSRSYNRVDQYIQAHNQLIVLIAQTHKALSDTLGSYCNLSYYGQSMHLLNLDLGNVLEALATLEKLEEMAGRIKNFASQQRDTYIEKDSQGMTLSELVGQFLETAQWVARARTSELAIAYISGCRYTVVNPQESLPGLVVERQGTRKGLLALMIEMGFEVLNIPPVFRSGLAVTYDAVADGSTVRSGTVALPICNIDIGYSKFQEYYGQAIPNRGLAIHNAFASSAPSWEEANSLLQGENVLTLHQEPGVLPFLQPVPAAIWGKHPRLAQERLAENLKFTSEIIDEVLARVFKVAQAQDAELVQDYDGSPESCELIAEETVRRNALRIEDYLRQEQVPQALIERLLEGVRRDQHLFMGFTTASGEPDFNGNLFEVSLIFRMAGLLKEHFLLRRSAFEEANNIFIVDEEGLPVYAQGRFALTREAQVALSEQLAQEGSALLDLAQAQRNEFIPGLQLLEDRLASAESYAAVTELSAGDAELALIITTITLPWVRAEMQARYDACLAAIEAKRQEMVAAAPEWIKKVNITLDQVRSCSQMHVFVSSHCVAEESKVSVLTELESRVQASNDPALEVAFSELNSRISWMQDNMEAQVQESEAIQEELIRIGREFQLLRTVEQVQQVLPAANLSARISAIGVAGLQSALHSQLGTLQAACEARIAVIEEISRIDKPIRQRIFMLGKVDRSVWIEEDAEQLPPVVAIRGLLEKLRKVSHSDSYSAQYRDEKVRALNELIADKLKSVRADRAKRQGERYLDEQDHAFAVAREAPELAGLILLRNNLRKIPDTIWNDLAATDQPALARRRAQTFDKVGEFCWQAGAIPAMKFLDEPARAIGNIPQDCNDLDSLVTHLIGDFHGEVSEATALEIIQAAASLDAQAFSDTGIQGIINEAKLTANPTEPQNCQVMLHMEEPLAITEEISLGLRDGVSQEVEGSQDYGDLTQYAGLCGVETECDCIGNTIFLPGDSEGWKYSVTLLPFQGELQRAFLRKQGYFCRVKIALEAAPEEKIPEPVIVEIPAEGQPALSYSGTIKNRLELLESQLEAADNGDIEAITEQVQQLVDVLEATPARRRTPAEKNALRLAQRILRQAEEKKEEVVDLSADGNEELSREKVRSNIEAALSLEINANHPVFFDSSGSDFVKKFFSRSSRAKLYRRISAALENIDIEIHILSGLTHRGYWQMKQRGGRAALQIFVDINHFGEFMAIAIHEAAAAVTAIFPDPLSGKIRPTSHETNLEIEKDFIAQERYAKHWLMNLLYGHWFSLRAKLEILGLRAGKEDPAGDNSQHVSVPHNVRTGDLFHAGRIMRLEIVDIELHVLICEISRPNQEYIERKTADPNPFVKRETKRIPDNNRAIQLITGHNIRVQWIKGKKAQIVLQSLPGRQFEEGELPGVVTKASDQSEAQSEAGERMIGAQAPQEDSGHPMTSFAMREAAAQFPEDSPEQDGFLKLAGPLAFLEHHLQLQDTGPARDIYFHEAGLPLGHIDANKVISWRDKDGVHINLSDEQIRQILRGTDYEHDTELLIVHRELHERQLNEKLAIAAQAKLFREGTFFSRPVFLDYNPVELKFGTDNMRGKAEDITDLEVYINVQGFLLYLERSGELVEGDTVALAGDLRDSTPRILEAVAFAVHNYSFQDGKSADLQVDFQGRLASPALTFYAFSRKFPSIMVTGAQSPPQFNGLRLFKKQTGILHKERAAIAACISRVRSREYAFSQHPLFNSLGALQDVSISRQALGQPGTDARIIFLERFQNLFPDQPLRGKKIVVYQHSSVARDLLPEMLLRLGAEVITECVSLGFEPLDTESISDEQYRTIESLHEKYTDAFAIVAADIDAEAPLIVDERGNVQRGDMLGLIVSKFLNIDFAAVPVTATDAVDEVLRKRGVKHYKTPVGYPHIIEAISQASAFGCGRQAGWEVDGAFILGNEVKLRGKMLKGHPARDSFLPLLVTLVGAADNNIAVSQLFTSLPQRFSYSGSVEGVPHLVSQNLLERLTPTASPNLVGITFNETRVYVHDSQDRVISTRNNASFIGMEALDIKATLEACFTADDGFPQVLNINFLDGIRVNFINGDICHLRPSRNFSVLRVYAVAATQKRAEAIVDACARGHNGILQHLMAIGPSRKLILSSEAVAAR
ncbi:MAG: hypothetical protein PHG68_03925, partial [Candidatus Omnitrophica bacterium]|nr:hypothetical protein [Candidatus Omnitrophota bacterium]